MSNIIPSTQKLFLAPNPKLVKETFIYFGRRYFLLSDGQALINESNNDNFCPPPDRGFYLKLPKKDFNEAKKKYDENRKIWLTKVGYLKAGGVQNTFAF